ncbi:MAG: fused MFS/spermidine synthase [Burkholderiales bacterium]|nr:fused MFS/spermidine synthase [Burkholderiales bacterium]
MPLVAVTIALSAFLLFLVQPIIAKQILPWFGGTSAVWTTCMVFFQVVLLGGYAYAHALSSRASPRNQARVHIALLAASLAFLPILAREGFKPVGDEDAALSILWLLAATIGLPYFLLSSTGPLLQRWIAHRFPEKTVYRLFALSNFGSLLGLLAFPFLIEPFAPTATQAYAWSAAYALFALACAVTAWQAQRVLTARAGEPAAAAGAVAALDAQAAAPGLRDYALWLALAALGSVLLLSTTSHITQNIASVPFLWVLPLTLYLLTFVLAFEGRGGRGWYERRWWLLPTLLLVVAMSWALSASRGVLDIGVAVPLYCAGLFFACMFCHGELAHAKPAPRYLTHFYLTLSAGGALGGLAVGLLAPRVFPAYFELPLALFALAAIASWLVLDNRTLIGPALIASAATAYSGWQYVDFVQQGTIVMQRSFHGTLRVRETGSEEQQVRRLLHGVIMHGEQFTVASDRLEPGTYYARSSGIGLAIAARQAAGPVAMGFVGLGVGTLSAYGRAGDLLRFYELDPQVIDVAQRHFTYLGASRAAIEFVIGDARLSLERELSRGGPRGYDVLAIDAFSSDSIPVHLITREAIELYARHLAPDGIIAVHISNRFLDLKPVLANIARATGLAAQLVSDSPQDDRTASSTDWVLLARDPAVLGDPQIAGRAEPLDPVPGFSLWTDQFNNLLDVLKVRPIDELRALLGLG